VIEAIAPERDENMNGSNQALSLTDAAAMRVKHLMSLRDEAEPIIGVKIGVKNAGCSGMSYTMDYAEAIGPHDEVVEDKGVKVIIEPTAVMFLIGTELDYKEDKLASGFVFNNPNVTSTCGCGESFSV
jgi:iron-sulfur cluster assembly protein